jgi:hypothetical protein
MGIQVEFNPDLALRKSGSLGRLEEECLPTSIVSGGVYPFLKKGQRNYWLNGEIPLLETRGDQQLSDPLASIMILEATHFLRDGETYTRGIYRVIEVFCDSRVHFNGFKKYGEMKNAMD